MKFLKKKVNKINILLLFLFLFCSNCSVNLQKCEFLPDFKDFNSKNIEKNYTDLKYYKEIIESGGLYAQAKCIFWWINNNMEEKNTNCQNCGHDCHCGGKCKQNYTDGDGKKIQIECCGNCRHSENEEKRIING